MKREELYRMRRRFVALPLMVVVCAALSIAHIRSVGATYALPLAGFGDAVITAANVHVEPPELARVLEVREGPDGVPVALVEGLAPGTGSLLVFLEDQGGANQLRVEPGPVVVADGANFTGWEVLPASVTLCFAVVSALCAWAVVTLARHAWYGYEMAAYAGGALFCVAEAVLFGWPLLSGEARTFVDFAGIVTGLADTFVGIMLVPMAVAALFVCATNVALLLREGARPANGLGIVASLAWAAACLSLRTLAEVIATSETIELFLLFSVVDSIVAIGVCLALALLAGTCACAWAAARHVPGHPRDYLVILGCGLMPDGSPTPLLAGRVDAALDYARRQEAAGLDMPTLVPSGGQGSDEPCSEAEAMRRYLMSRGADGARVLLEDRSTTTRENFVRAAQVIAADGGTGEAVAFATTNYHILRGYVYAHDAGLAAEGIAAPTRLYFWPNAFLREFVGLLASRWPVITLSYALVAGIYIAGEYALFLTFG